MTGASEVVVRGDVGVGAAGSEIEEEGGVFATLNKFDRFLGEGGVDHVFDPRLGDAFGKMLALNEFVFFTRNPSVDVVVLDKDARSVIVVGGDAKVIVEASFQWAGDGRLVHIFAVSEMPFANSGGFVAKRLEEGGDIELVWVEAVTVPFLAQSPRRFAGEESVARRGAKGGGGVSIDELHAVLGELVDVGGVDEVGAVTAKVSKSEVIRKDKNNIGWVGW